MTLLEHSPDQSTQQRAAVSPRPHSHGEKRFPWPIPNGWFAVAESAQLRPGQVLSVSYFNRELVAFRTRSGRAKVFDAYCPHLGAHLGDGSVFSESLRCPFHAWRFDADTGRCVDIPYLTDGSIPAKAAVYTYEVVERAGVIFVWHHLENEPPWYDVPTIPEFDDPEWTGAEVHEFFVDSACQEMAENSADYAHFKYVHGTAAIPEDDLHIDGHYRRTEGRSFQDGLPNEGPPAFIRESYGLGLGVLHVGDFFAFVSSTTPIDEEHLHVRWIFTAKKSFGDMKDTMVANFLGGVADDLPIWNKKIYQDPPLLVHGDGPIGRYRKWAEQFYSVQQRQA
jgi:phenylpropionate dioxygenase-like ring-hydroxylating dioxygenase large terminal subunit